MGRRIGRHGERDIAAGKRERRLGAKHELGWRTRDPALGIDCLKRKALGEMAIEGVAKRLRFAARDAQRGRGNEQQAVAHQAQVRGIGARPRIAGGLAAAREQRQRARRERLLAELERVVQPVFEPARRVARAAPARDQQLRRGQPRCARRRQQPGDYELAVHRARGSTRAAPLPR